MSTQTRRPTVKNIDECNLVTHFFRQALLQKANGSEEDAAAMTKVIFENLDKDNSGHISVQEVKEFLRDVDLSSLKELKPEERDYYMDLIIYQLDLDGNGHITVGELSKFLWPRLGYGLVASTCRKRHPANSVREALIKTIQVDPKMNDLAVLQAIAKFYKMSLRQPGNLLTNQKLRLIFKGIKVEPMDDNSPGSTHLEYAEINQVFAAIDINNDHVVTAQEMYYFLFPPIVRIGGRTNGHIRSIGGRVGLHIYQLVFTYDEYFANWFGSDEQGDEVLPFVLDAGEYLVQVFAWQSGYFRGDTLKFVTSTGREYVMGSQSSLKMNPNISIQAPEGSSISSILWDKLDSGYVHCNILSGYFLSIGQCEFFEVFWAHQDGPNISSRVQSCGGGQEVIEFFAGEYLSEIYQWEDRGPKSVIHAGDKAGVSASGGGVRGNAAKFITTRGRQLIVGNKSRLQEPPTLHLLAPESSSIYEIDFLDVQTGEQDIIAGCTFTSLYKSSSKTSRRIIGIGGRVAFFPSEMVSQVILQYNGEDDAAFGDANGGFEVGFFSIRDASEYLVEVKAWRGDYTCRGQAIKFVTSLNREFVLIGPSCIDKILNSRPDFYFRAPGGSCIISLEWDNIDSKLAQSCLIGCYCAPR